MGRSIYAIAILALIICAGLERSVRAETMELVIDGQPRSYLLERPNGRTPAPTLIMLHGVNGKAEILARQTGLTQSGPQQGFAVVFPQSRAGYWNRFAPGKESPQALELFRPFGGPPNDIGFLKMLVADLVRGGVTDPARVHLVGYSNGGFMTLSMFCFEGGMFAGIGLVVSSMTEQTGEECRPAKPLPVVILSGTADTVVPYQGGALPAAPFAAAVWSTDRLLTFFRRQNGCVGSAETSLLPAAQRVEVERWTNCAVGPVLAHKVIGGTHASAPNALNIGSMLLDFFGEPAQAQPYLRVAAAAAVDDETACYRGVAGAENIAACSRLIAARSGTELARAYFRRGFLHGRRGERDDFDRAIADCSEARRLQPSNWHPLYVRAAAYIRKGDLDRALTDLNEAMRLAPQDTGVRNVFGYYHYAKGDYDRALHELNEALRINPNNPFAARYRGLAYEKRGELDNALADFRIALRSDPERNEMLGREAAEGIDRIEKRLAVARPQPAPQPRVEPTPAPVSPPAPAPTTSGRPSATEPVRRIALVVGNAKYPDADPPLSQPTAHARSFADELRKSGYEVEVGENLTKQELQRAINGFKAKITPGSVALLFFSGYALQADRQTYMLPVDAQVWAEKDVVRDGLKLESLLTEMNDRGAAGKLVILDASRRNPYERRFRSAPAGLAPVTTPPETLVIYAAAAGQVVNDESGAFVAELTKEIRTPSVTAEEAFIRTRIGLSSVTRGQQIPWMSSSLTTDLRFARTER